MDPDKKKYINIGLAVVGAGAAYLIGRRIYFGVKNKVNSKMLENLATQLSFKSTLTSTAARNIADGFHDAFNYWGGTDLTTVDTCLAQINNEYDWLLVRRAFGSKAYGTTGTPWFGNGTNLSLIGWCRAELSGSRLTQCESLENKANALGLDGVL